MEKLYKHQFINIILNDIHIVTSSFLLYTILFIYMYSILSVIIVVTFYIYSILSVITVVTFYIYSILLIIFI